jgi:hypothetical protein
MLSSLRHPDLLQLMLGALTLGVKRPDLEPDHLSPCRAMKSGVILSLPKRLHGIVLNYVIKYEADYSSRYFLHI